MNFLDPEAVRAYFADLREHGVKYSHANNVYAMERFVRAVAALKYVEVHDEMNEARCAACKSEKVVAVARILVEALGGSK